MEELNINANKSLEHIVSWMELEIVPKQQAVILRGHRRRIAVNRIIMNSEINIANNYGNYEKCWGTRKSQEDSIIQYNTVHTFVCSSISEGYHEGKNAIKRAQEHPTKSPTESGKWIQNSINECYTGNNGRPFD